MSPRGPSQAQRPSEPSRTVDSSKKQPRLVVIGNFDGVHLGHQSVLVSARARAQADGLALCVLTFDPHPAAVLSGKTRPVLTTTSRKAKILREAFPDLEVVVQHFDLDLAALSPREFVRRILVDQLHARVILVGENFRFGKNRAGDLSTLRELGSEFGFEARSEPLRGDAQGTYSSTRVRELLSSGNVAGASQLLGRPHWVSGKVIRGDQRGRTLGFPTANLQEVPQTLPAEGVYAVEVSLVEGTEESALGRGVAHLGARPSVERPPSFEVHLLDQEIDLYGKTLGVTFVERIRAVERFADLDALKQQIAQDIQMARAVLNSAATTQG